jgi:hypothetical protein
MRPLNSIARYMPIVVAASALAAPGLLQQPVSAQNFEVYCTNNSDGTTTCTGWEGGETLTCVNNAGGTSSCSTSSGRGFDCVLDSGGVASCRRDKGSSAVEKPLGGGTDCTFTGAGNFTCTPPRKQAPEVLPSPTLTQPVVIDQPAGLNPDVDFDVIQPLSP